MLKQVQDNEREKALIKQFGLEPFPGRQGCDALLNGAKFELKTTTKNSVSTARDVTLPTIEKWRPLHWLIASGQNTDKGFRFVEVYYLSPIAMKPWLDKIEKRLSGDRCVNDLVEFLTNIKYKNLESVKKRLEKMTALNNPGISMQYVRERGVLFPPGAGQLDLLKVLSLETSKPLVRHTSQYTLRDI